MDFLLFENVCYATGNYLLLEFNWTHFNALNSEFTTHSARTVNEVARTPTQIMMHCVPEPSGVCLSRRDYRIKNLLLVGASIATKLKNWTATCAFLRLARGDCSDVRKDAQQIIYNSMLSQVYTHYVIMHT